MTWARTSEAPPPRGTAVLGYYPELAPGTCYRVVRRRTASTGDAGGAYTCFTWRDLAHFPVPEPAFWCALPPEPA